MTNEPISLDHTDLLRNRLSRCFTGLSEYSFTNLYLFRREHAYMVTECQNGRIWITGNTRKGIAFAMPTEDLRTIPMEEITQVIKNHQMIYPIPEEWTTPFMSNQWLLTYDIDESDYIHSTEKLESYPGKKMHKKRNLFNQFTRSYVPEIIPLTSDSADIAIEILKMWQDESKQEPEETDYYPALEALQMRERLHICGCIFIIDGEPAGFVMGEELSSDFFALHFVKGLRDYKGIYQYMYSHASSGLKHSYKYFNFEQDMGSPQLRQAKKSYHPEMMLDKYSLTLK